MRGPPSISVMARPKRWPLAVRKINGIGPKTGERLAALGVQTIADLAALPLPTLYANFGQKTAAWLHDAAWGRDDRAVQTSTEPVSLSRETTFERDLHAVRDKAELGEMFTALCQRVAADLQRRGLVGRTIGIKLRYADFSIATRDNTIDLPTADAAVIRQAAGQALKRVDLSRRIRLLGVRVGKLSQG